MTLARLSFGCMLLCGILASAALATEHTKMPPVEVVECARDRAPGLDGVRAVRVVEWDRVGSRHVATVRLHTRRSGDTREVLVRFTEPVDLRGNAVLLVESPQGRELYFWSQELGGSKRVRGTEKSMALFGRTFSYEDFEHMLASYRPGEYGRVEETVFGSRRVSLVETHPSDAENSAYETVVTMFDLQTCTPLRLELYESGHSLRKVISADPLRFQEDGISLPNMVVSRDMRDFTTTLLMLDFSEPDPFPEDVPSFERMREGLN